MPMQFRTFEEATTWYDLRAQLVQLLSEKCHKTSLQSFGEFISLNDAASVLASYLYGPSQGSNRPDREPNATNTFGL